MYVRCDALTNYLTGQGFGRNDQREAIWPADVHVIGKDILRFHAAFWPAMLISAKLPLPKTLLAHGHLTLNGAMFRSMLMEISLWRGLQMFIIVC